MAKCFRKKVLVPTLKITMSKFGPTLITSDIDVISNTISDDWSRIQDCENLNHEIATMAIRQSPLAIRLINEDDCPNAREYHNLIYS